MAISRIRRLPFVEDCTGKGKTSIYADIGQKLFPPPVLIGKRAVGWPEEECQAINAARIAGKSPEQIRALVAQIVAARTRA